MIRTLAVSLGALIGCGDGAIVRVERDDTVLLEVVAETAETAEERSRGLRDHPPLAPDEGLLIVMPAPVETCIVNDGVDFAIDAVYAADTGEVVAIERDVPAGDGTARCHDDVRRVLELAAGGAEPVLPGDRLRVE